jgi:hypothetical protein
MAGYTRRSRRLSDASCRNIRAKNEQILVFQPSSGGTHLWRGLDATLKGLRDVTTDDDIPLARCNAIASTVSCGAR